MNVVWINGALVLGLLIGFRTGTPVSAEWAARIAVLFLTLFNLMIFVAVPRVAAAKAGNGIVRTLYGELWAAVFERPVVTVVCAIQLAGVAQSLGSALTLLRTIGSDYVKGLSDPESIKIRLLIGSIIMFCVALVWLLGAVGVWRIRKWAWWLTLCLNGLASSVTVALQIFTPRQLLIDVASVASIAAVILLLLPSTRKEFRIRVQPKSVSAEA